MKTRLRRLFYRAAVAVPAPAPAPSPNPVTAALLTLTTPNATANVGDPITATLAPGIIGDFTFVRNGSTNIGSATGNSGTYSAVLLDADQRVNVLAGNLTFSAGLTPALDAAAVVSFYGTATAGSTLTAAMIAGTTGTVTIKRADGTTAAGASGAASVSYTLTSGDMANLPFTATASNLVLTATFSGVAAPTQGDVSFVTLQAFQASPSSVAAGDVFSARLADGVLGTINFASNGTIVPNAQSSAPLLNGAAYIAVASDVGHTISAVISGLTFTTGGVYGTPVMQDATGAARIYGLDISDIQRNRIRIGYLALNNLDTSSVPPTSAFTLSGAIQNAKTITAVSIDNADPEVKYVYVDVSSNFQPGDAPTLQYAGTAIRYPGGAAAAGFTLPVFSSIPPPATLMYASHLDTRATSPSAGVVSYSVANAGWVAEMVFNPSQSPRFGTTQDCLIQMSILPDWGTNGTIIRCVALDPSPPSQGIYDQETYSLRRLGNTVGLWERANGTSNNSQKGGTYTFASPGSLCLARISYKTADLLVRLETSEDGGTTWTQRSIGTRTQSGNLFPTAYTSSTTVPVTGVGTTGFAPT